MKRTINQALATALGVLVLLGLAVAPAQASAPAAPAQAAAKAASCRTGYASLGKHRHQLTANGAPHLSTRVYSFRVSAVTYGGARRVVKTFIPRSWWTTETLNLHVGRVIKVESWKNGTKCSDWKTIVGGFTGVAAKTEASAQAAPAIKCSTSASYNKATNKTTVRVTTNRPTSKKIFDYRLQYEDSKGNNTAKWVKNKGMKIVVTGKYFGGYAYQNIVQCQVFGEGIGIAIG
jgi:hypothetical protein